MKFADYPIAPELKQRLAAQGFKRPTDIQYKAIPSILQGEDVLAIAQTGTGKTAAFAIPILHRLHQQKRSKRSDGIRCLVMVPTHELAIQLKDVFGNLGARTRVKTFAIFGGVEQDPQIHRLKKGIDVLIATPGRVFDLVNQQHLQLNQVEVLVLDEADHMLDLGFYKDIQDLIRFLPAKRQTLFFSATINERIKKLAYSLVNNPIRIQISPKDPVTKNVDHALVHIEMDDKRFFLERFVNEHPDAKILVFVRTKVRAERVVSAMERVALPAMALHGDMPQEDRLKTLNVFKEGDVPLLIATDVSARGIDIPDVDFVINYDLPEQADNYVHRIGRTGRGRQRGHAVSFCSPREKELLEKIEGYLGYPLEVLPIAQSDYQQTLSMTQDQEPDWKKLMEQAEAEPTKKKKGKKRRKK